MSRPQAAGILPTWWFWRDMRFARPILGAFVGGTVGAVAVALGNIAVAAGASLAACMLVTLCAVVLGFGAFERALRAMVLRRRRAIARGLAELPALCAPSGGGREKRWRTPR